MFTCGWRAIIWKISFKCTQKDVLNFRISDLILLSSGGKIVVKIPILLIKHLLILEMQA